MVTNCNGRGGVIGKIKHCCMLSGVVCDYLVDTGVVGPGRFRCGLYLELGSWDAVEADPRYIPIAEHFGNPRMCREWQPRNGQCCLEPRGS